MPRALLLLAPIVALACVPPPRKVAPPVPLPRAFSRSAARALPERWWRGFGDPVLDRLVEQALSGNLTLRQAWDRLDQASASLGRARAGLYPSLEGTLGASAIHSRSEKRISLMAGLAASYELDLWGRVRSSRDAARLDKLASEESLRAAAIGLAAEVALAWYQLVEKHGQLELMKEQLATNEKVLELVTIKFRKGQGSSADVLQQRQLVESIRGEQAQVIAQAEVLGLQLALLAGRAPGQPVAPRVHRLPPLPPLPQTGVPAALLARRPDVRSAHLQVQAADRRAATALAERFPRLSLTAGGSVGAVFDGAWVGSWLANLAANLLAPIFDGGARRAEVERTRAVVAEALHRYGQVVLVALREVEDALARERQQTLLLASLDQQLKISGLVIDQTRQSYLYGGEQYLRVLDAMIRHQALQRARLAAERALREHRIALCRALAGGFELARPAEPRVIARRAR